MSEISGDLHELKLNLCKYPLAIKDIVYTWNSKDLASNEEDELLVDVSNTDTEA